jgi:hypothetical protein
MYFISKTRFLGSNFRRKGKSMLPHLQKKEIGNAKKQRLLSLRN